MRNQAEPGRGVNAQITDYAQTRHKRVSYHELANVRKYHVRILNSLGDTGTPSENRYFAGFMYI